MLLNPKFNLVCLCIMKTFFFYLIRLPLGTINAWLQIHTDLFRAGSPMGNGSEGHVSSVLCREGVLGEGLLHQGGEEN